MNNARYAYADKTDIIRRQMLKNLSVDLVADTWFYEGKKQALDWGYEGILGDHPLAEWFKITKDNVTIQVSQLSPSYFYEVDSWITNGDGSITKLSCKEFHRLFDNNDDFIGLPRRIPTKSARKVV